MSAARGGRTAPTAAASPRGWTFLTNHAHVLLALAEDADLRIRDLGERVGITERAVQTILTDLEDEGYIVRERVGRRNHYRVVRGRHMRHPTVAAHRVDDLLQALS